MHEQHFCANVLRVIQRWPNVSEHSWTRNIWVSYSRFCRNTGSESLSNGQISLFWIRIRIWKCKPDFIHKNICVPQYGNVASECSLTALKQLKNVDPTKIKHSMSNE